MSLITEVVVYGASERSIGPLNEWLKGVDHRRQQFQPIDMDAAGGTKYFVVQVWAAAFNYAPIGLRERLRDPQTWGNEVLSVAVVMDDESVGLESFCFAAPSGQRDYVPSTNQASCWQ